MANSSASNFEVRKVHTVRIGGTVYTGEQLQKLPPSLYQKILAVITQALAREKGNAGQVQKRCKLGRVEVAVVRGFLAPEDPDSTHPLGAVRRREYVSLTSDFSSGIRNSMTATGAKVAAAAAPILGTIGGVANVGAGAYLTNDGIQAISTAIAHNDEKGQIQGCLTTGVGLALMVVGVAMMVFFGGALTLSGLGLPLLMILGGVVAIGLAVTAGKLTPPQAMKAFGAIVALALCVALGTMLGLGLPLLMGSATALYTFLPIRAGFAAYNTWQFRKQLLAITQDSAIGNADKAFQIIRMLDSYLGPDASPARKDEFIRLVGPKCAELVEKTLPKMRAALNARDHGDEREVDDAFVILWAQTIVEKIDEASVEQLSKQWMLLAISFAGMFGLWFGAPLIGAAISALANALWLFVDSRECGSALGYGGNKLHKAAFKPTWVEGMEPRKESVSRQSVSDPIHVEGEDEEEALDEQERIAACRASLERRRKSQERVAEDSAVAELSDDSGYNDFSDGIGGMADSELSDDEPSTPSVAASELP